MSKSYALNVKKKNELESKITEMKKPVLRSRPRRTGKSERGNGSAAFGHERTRRFLTRLTFNAPVRGIVKDIDVTTVGGVIPPNGKLMSLVPLDDQMVIEAKISPRDVAFIHPGQKRW